MDTRDASDSPEWRPNSNLSGGPLSTATSSLLRPPQPSISDRSSSSASVAGYDTTVASGDMAVAEGVREIAPWETITCDRLVAGIRAFSKQQDETTRPQPTVQPPTLHSALREAAITIQYNSKWFSGEALAALLDTALDTAASSSASGDLHAAIALTETVITYSLLPPQSLDRTVRFIASAYYNASRAYKTQKLANAAWTTLQHLLESHLGGQCVVVLLGIVDCRDEEYLASKVGYTVVAGALMVISEKLLLTDGTRDTMPTLGLAELLDSLWGTAVNGNDNLRESIMEMIIKILADENAVSDLHAQSSWDVLLEAVEPCVALSPHMQASKSVVEALTLHFDHFDPRHLPTIVQLNVNADLPLPQQLSNEMLAPWAEVLPTRGMPRAYVELLKKLCTSSRYVPELQVLVDKGTDEASLKTTSRENLAIYVRTLQDTALDPYTTEEAAAVLAKSLVAMFELSERGEDQSQVANNIFNPLCKISRRCMDAARMLFRLRADVEGKLYMKTDPLDADNTNRSNFILRGASSLSLQTWDEALLDVVQGLPSWTIYDYFLTELTRLLGNHKMFDNRLEFIKKLGAVVCGLLDSGNFQEPPAETGLSKSYVATQLVRMLTVILSYHRQLQRQDIFGMVSVFLNISGSRDYVVSIPCVHALTICCYELPDLMSSYIDDVIDKMSKIVTQRYLAIHVLLFLAGLSRLPDLFRNFQTHDYKKIFGVCGSYLQSIRGTSALNEREQTPSSDRSSRTSAEKVDALPQYVYALAHHVVAFWYLALKPEHRQGLKDYITSCLRYTTADGQEMIEDQGLVTTDLMDRVDAEESKDDADESFDENDGRITVRHRLAGLLLITTETAMRTGKTVIIIRRPTGTSKRFIKESTYRNRERRNSLAITVDSNEDDYINIFPDDATGRIYGRIRPPSAASSLGSGTTLLLPDDDFVARAIQSIDRTPALDSHKAGVIYIGEGQTSEDDIFQNVMGSSDYVEFVEGLGNLMRLKNATFNTQGLDRMTDADGQHAIVWYNEVTELVFHVTTLMPNNEDVKMNTANKKRHIGNDYVNIIFNNSGSAFDFNTFPSQFNSVYIVITPSARTTFLQTRTLKSKMGKQDRFYKVQVMTRPGYPEISSAAEEKVISGASLPGYVRNLALNDCVFSLMWSQRGEAGEYPSSWRSRLDQIRRLRSKYEGRVE